jgi:uncharacterized cupredoxin-like copper-binding protein
VVAPRRRGVRWAKALAVVALLTLAIGIPLAAPLAHAAAAGRAVGYAHYLPSVTGGNGTFAVNLSDAPAFSPASLTGAKVGQNISIELTNVGSFNHTFTLSKVPDVTINQSFDPGMLYAWFAANGSLANVSLGPGQTGWANFTIPANSTGGSYEFVSLVPYQFQAGMHGELLVSSGAPAASLSDDAEQSLTFLPNALQVNATKYPITVAIAVTDVGPLAHTWTLSPFPNFVLSSANFTAFFAAHAPLISLTVTTPGQVANGTFTISAPGVYEYICEEPGHFSNGMFGYLYVGVTPPAPPATPSTAIVQEGILAGAGTLLVIAVLVAWSSNYLGRFPPPSTPPHH